jgi:hypothetical protein
MGMSAEFGRKLGLQLYREMLEERLPRNLKLIPYDALLQAFEIQMPPLVHVLVPALPNHEIATQDLPPEQLRSQVVDLWNAIERSANEYVARNLEAFGKSSHGMHPDWLIRYSLPDKYANVTLLRDKIKNSDAAFSISELNDLSQQLASALNLIEKNYLSVARDSENETPGIQRCFECGGWMDHPDNDTRVLLCRNCGRYEQWSD